jgi:hypothetical protein
MSTSTIPESELAIQPSWRRYPLTYPRALELARELVVEEANQRGSYLSEDEIELRVARRAAVLLRNY